MLILGVHVDALPVMEDGVVETGLKIDATFS